jgi:ACR3 family arsenite transporter
LVQVSINDIIMVLVFAPLVAWLLGIADVIVPWSVLLMSVLLYVVVPLAAGIGTRFALIGKEGDESRINAFSARLKPYTIVGLLATVVLLFAFQGSRILEQPLVILMIAIPLVIQSYGIFAIAYGWAWAWQVPFAVAAPAALIGTSNFFELAVAVSVSLFGLESGAVLATVVGVLVEVPVMLSLVAFANRTQIHFPDPSALNPREANRP